MISMTSLPDGYRAAVIGATGAIGGAIADALEHDRASGEVLRFGRSAGRGVDVTQEASVAAAAEEVGEIDLLFIATGALTLDERPPEKALSQLDPAALAAQFALNAVGPALVIKHFAPKLARRRRVLLAALSARVGSIGDNRLGGWHGYRAAKAALNQFVRGAAVEIGRTRPEAVALALHPGTVQSPLTHPFRPAGAAEPGVFTPQEAAEKLLNVLDAASPAQSGGFFDYAGAAVPW